LQTLEVQRDDGCRHHREPRMLSGHLMDRRVRTLNRQLHQVLDVFAVVQSMTERFVEDINGGLGSDFAGFGAPHAIGDCEDAALVIAEEGILIQWPLIVEPAIRN
jgi:hypothetical protein